MAEVRYEPGAGGDAFLPRHRYSASVACTLLDMGVDAWSPQGRGTQVLLAVASGCLMAWALDAIEGGRTMGFVVVAGFTSGGVCMALLRDRLPLGQEHAPQPDQLGPMRVVGLPVHVVRRARRRTAWACVFGNGGLFLAAALSVLVGSALIDFIRQDRAETQALSRHGAFDWGPIWLTLGVVGLATLSALNARWALTGHVDPNARVGPHGVRHPLLRIDLAPSAAPVVLAQGSRLRVSHRLWKGSSRLVNVHDPAFASELANALNDSVLEANEASARRGADA